VAQRRSHCGTTCPRFRDEELGDERPAADHVWQPRGTNYGSEFFFFGKLKTEWGRSEDHVGRTPGFPEICSGKFQATWRRSGLFFVRVNREFFRNRIGMQQSPITRPSLLFRIRDAQDRQAWNQFVDIYAPLIHRFSRRSGLQDADAADLTQEVLQSVHDAIGRLDYDPQRGKFRSWLFTVARNRIKNFLKRQSRHPRGTGDTEIKKVLDNHPTTSDEQEAAWDEDYEQRLFHWTADQIRPEFKEHTWQAFWKTAVDGQETKQVAEMLSMSLGAVYVAKSRVLGRFKEQIDQIEQ
jgi:RNA polymerase sigma-70 factor (ECF subfamily)